MRCPFCGAEDSQVKDSRPVEDGTGVRRRRQCGACGARFTTFERPQLREITVVKKDGRKVAFDRDKLVRSLLIATRKRGIEAEQLERVVSAIVRRIETSGESEIQSDTLGDLVLDGLEALDQVAYVRFASVYKDFANTDDFVSFIKDLARRDEG